MRKLDSSGRKVLDSGFVMDLKSTGQEAIVIKAANTKKAYIDTDGIFHGTHQTSGDGMSTGHLFMFGGNIYGGGENFLWDLICTPFEDGRLHRWWYCYSRLRFRVYYSDLATDDTTNTKDLFWCMRAMVIRDIYACINTTFEGGGISGYTVEVGPEADSDKYLLPLDVHTATGKILDHSYKGSCLQNPADTNIESFAEQTKFVIKAISTGADLDAATQGWIDIYVCVEHVANNWYSEDWSGYFNGFHEVWPEEG